MNPTNNEQEGKPENKKKQKKVMQYATESHPYTDASIEMQSGYFNRLFFMWTSEANSFYLLNLVIVDLFEVTPVEKFSYGRKKFIEHFNSTGQASVVKSMLSFMKYRLPIAQFLLVLANLSQFAGPLLLKEIIFYLDDDKDYSAWQAYLFAFGLFFSYFFRALWLIVIVFINFSLQHGFHQTNKCSFGILSSLESLIFTKLLALSQTSKGLLDPGKLTNLATIDAIQIFMFSQFGSFLITSPIMIFVALGFIINEVGWAGFIGVILVFIGTFINSWIAKKMQQKRKNIQQFQDERGKAVSEMISGIKIIKYYGWENLILEKVMKIRIPEIVVVYSSNLLRGGLEVFTTILPLIIIVITFTLYIEVFGNELTPAKAMTTLGFFNLMQVPLRMFGFAFFSFANVIVSFKRISHFSLWKEKDTSFVSSTIEKGSIQIQNGYFQWNTVEDYEHLEQFKKLLQQKTKTIQPPPILTDEQKALQQIGDQELIILKNINVNIKPGEFVAVIGQVGSGKSSLVQAMIGEMYKAKGQLAYNGKIAYISQTAWLLNASLKDNIIFYEAYDEEKYQEIIKLCELEDDIKQLQQGDATEIGEKGINLSGGQKQRVSLARAIYSNSDIFIIDDILAALDAHVGKNIFENLILKKISGKTRLFITHAIHYARRADRIIVMKDGEIVEVGTAQELSIKQNSEFNKLSMKEEDKEQQEFEEEGIIEEIIEEEEQNNSNQSIDEGQINLLDKYGKDQEQVKLNAQQLKELSLKQKNSSRIHQEILDEQIIYEGSRKISIKKVRKISIDNPQLEKIVVIKQVSQRKMSERKEDKPLASPTQKTVIIKGKAAGETVERQESGAVPFQVYKSYALLAGWKILVIIAICFVMTQGLVISNELWIGFWSNDSLDISSQKYIYGYLGISLLTCISVFSRGWSFSLFSKNISFMLSKQVLFAILRSPMSWFDITPSGRILNRTNKDQDDVDQMLPWTVQFSLNSFFTCISYFIMVGTILPLFFIFIIIAFVYYIYLCATFLKSARELKRVQSLARAPAMSIFSEVFFGNVVIRSYQKESNFLETVERRFDVFIKAAQNNFAMNRWIQLKTDFFICLIVGCVGLLSVLSKDFNYTDSSALVGVALVGILKITGVLSFTVRIMADTELQMGAVQRLFEYANKPEKEAEWDTPEVKKEWPQKGVFEMKNLIYNYGAHLPDVIKGISFSVGSHEKIGVVGRTGSGKSTLTLGLLRILEMANPDGFIKLDGQDIKDIGLHHLRRNVTIIPQDPILFRFSFLEIVYNKSGTIRSNIDPFNEYPNSEIITALKKISIWDSLKAPENYEKDLQNIKDKQEAKTKLAEFNSLNEEEKVLLMQIQEGGSNFSLGQRQLLCMGRALIRKTKVLLMDEATASIDEMTDFMIQKMIQTEFVETTVITIAHRLNTIIQYDKILVLDQGTIAEFDKPWTLLQNKESYFTKLIQENGPEFEEKMKKLAEEKHFS